MKNTKNKLLMSVAAAALIAGAGVASAQAPSPAPAAQQSAPAEKMGPALKETTPEAAKPGQKASEPKADIKKDKGAQAPAAAPATKSTIGQAPAPDSKSPGKTRSEMKADGKTKADAKSSDIKPEAQSPAKAGDAKSSEKPATTTTGQGAAASLTTEQRTTIRTSIRQQNVQPVTNVNFSISIGTRVPKTVRFYPVPMELVTIYPSWRGYDYFLVGDQIIVVDPRTHEIVAVLDA